jgi:hypothetical protein
MVNQPKRSLISDAVSVFSGSNQSSDSTEGDRMKRRRKVLACYDCRRRKLHCDRVMPACGRCVKTGHATSCTYSDDAAGASTRAPLLSRAGSHTPGDLGESQPCLSPKPRQTSEDPLSTLKSQDRRARRTEATLPPTSHPVETVEVCHREIPEIPVALIPVQGHDTSSASVNPETMLLRGKSFETQFSGTTHPLALISYLPELNSFTEEALKTCPRFNRARQDLRTLEAHTKAADRDLINFGDKGLQVLLPQKADVDKAVQMYFSSYDRVYHVIHGPSFWSAYNIMWQGGIGNAPQRTVALVLLILSCVSCLDLTHPWSYVANSSKARRTAIGYIYACEAWINRQSQKHVSAVDFQIRFLICLAKQTTATKYKRTWTETGTLLRFCMSAGLHRNPDLLRKPTSLLDKELRSRIWASVIDLDLQASFDRGMISSSEHLQSDCPSPRNLRDDEISVEHVPTSRPARDFTSSWYLALASDTAVLKGSLNAILNNSRHLLTFDEVKKYTDDIESHLQAIPESPGPSSEEARSLLVLKLLQYQLALHNQFLRFAATFSERNFSAMTIVDTANKIVTIHRDLISNEKRSLQFISFDLLRASLSMANVMLLRSVHTNGPLAIVTSQYAGLVGEAINMLSDRASRLGCEQRQVWIALAANGIMKARKEPRRRTEYLEEAVDTITRMYDMVLVCQETAVSPISVEERQQEDLENIVERLPAMTAEPNVVHHDADWANLASFDFDDLAAWSFEDWMANPSNSSESFFDAF